MGASQLAQGMAHSTAHQVISRPPSSPRYRSFTKSGLYTKIDEGRRGSRSLPRLLAVLLNHSGVVMLIRKVRMRPV